MGTTRQEDIPNVNIQTPNMGTPEHIEPLLTNTKSSTEIQRTGGRQRLTESTHRWCRQKISKETGAVGDTLDQTALADTVSTFHPRTAKHTFSASSYGTLSRIDHTSGHKTSHNKFKDTEVRSHIFSDHNGTKPETMHPPPPNPERA